MQEDKLEPSEQLGDLLKQAGDADAALKCYRASGATTKVIEGGCMKRDSPHTVTQHNACRLTFHGQQMLNTVASVCPCASLHH